MFQLQFFVVQSMKLRIGFESLINFQMGFITTPRLIEFDTMCCVDIHIQNE